MPSATAGTDQLKSRASRVIDLSLEPLKMLPTISGYLDAAHVSLEKAIQPLLPFLPATLCHANNAKDQCQKPPADGLTVDESAAIMLYTMSWKPPAKCIHHALNAALRSEDRTKLEPWYLYLKLFFSGLERLPSFQQIVYRGIKHDMRNEYKEGETILWWGVSSCTTSIDVLQSEVFKNTTDLITIFSIESNSAKDIHNHSAHPNENEILILPGIEFKVVSCLNQEKNLLKIKLQETSSSSLLRQPVLAPVKIKDTTRLKQNQDEKSSIDRNKILIWLDNGKAHEGEGYRNTMTRLHQIIETVHAITDPNEFMKLINENSTKKIYIIISGSLGQELVPNIHDLPQIDTIFVFCGSRSRHSVWANKYLKINDLYTDITELCDAIKKIIKEQSISFKSTGKTEEIKTQKSDQFDRSFIYIQILKEIILQTQFVGRDFKDFIAYCRQQFDGNDHELKSCHKLKEEYRKHTSIWWCTSDCFLYSMLNRALITFDIDLILKMGFFIQHLHQEIEKLHAEQFRNNKQSSEFTVYRGQSLTKTEFDQLMIIKGGLLSFNNFTSTSKHQDITMNFIRQTINNPDLIGVLFCMKINPSIPSTPYALIDDVAFSNTDGEILFSMHSIFRIDDIKQIDKNDRLWQIDLSLTNDNDPQLHLLTKHMQEETEGETGWHRLGKLLLAFGLFDKAEEIFNNLLTQTDDNQNKTTLFDQLGLIKCKKGEFTEAIKFYEKSLDIRQRFLPHDHSDIADSYNYIGSAYEQMKNHSKATAFYEKAIKIGERSLSPKHPTIQQWRKRLENVKKE